MRRWTELVIRHRKKIIAAWVALFVLGGAATASLGSLLTNRFSVPGSDAERGLNLIKKKFGERGDGTFTIVFEVKRGTARDPQVQRAAEQAAARAARLIRGAKPGPVQLAGNSVAYVQINSPLENEDGAKKTPAMRKAIGSVPGVKTYLSGFPAINHDTQKIYNDDLARGESIAVPIALAVIAYMFGTLIGVAVPMLFALITIPTTLGLVWIAAHFTDMAVYVQNIVTLIGLAIAIDYSMLVVYRFREELERSDDHHAALLTTMATAGRATMFSGLTVAVGLALLVLMPLPFMQSMGIGGLLVPLVSIAAAATLLPALLAGIGTRINRFRFIPRRVLESRAQGTRGFWTWLAHTIMRRPIPVLVISAGVMLALALPATELRLTGGDNRGVPLTTESTKGLALLERTLGAGALAPNQIVVDTGRPGGAFAADTVAAEQRLMAQLRRDPEIDPRTMLAPALIAGRPGAPPPDLLQRLRQANLVDAEGRVLQIRVAGRGDSGTQEAKHLVERLRDRYIPAAGFGRERVLVSGAPAFGVDFIDKAYSAFPWLVLAVLVLSYLLLLRAFRSLFLPVKAVLMNLLSVSATYGVLVLVFQHGIGKQIGLFGETPEIEAWIPIFLFAMLFGLSMDYEVFLLSRMREEWDKHRDNEAAVSSGLEHTGRIITAAAVIMVAAFSGFTAGSFVGLQEFGLGLSAAIILDATIVRALLAEPGAGRYRVGRSARVTLSRARARPRAARRAG
jgi:RND superfamily putative drug exporter